MRKKLIILICLILLIVSIFFGKVNARGGVFVIEPTKEITDNVELAVSDTTSANVSGKSVSG